MNNSVTVQIIHLSYDLVQSLFETEKTTVTSLSTSLSENDDVMITTIKIMANPEINLFSIVDKAISQINAIYPASASIID